MILQGREIPKFKTDLLILPIFKPVIVKNPLTNKVVSHNYVITASRIMEQALPPGYPQTEFFGYGGVVYFEENPYKVYKGTLSPGPTIMATRGVTINVKWKNNLNGNNPLPVDPTICWADPNNIGMIEPQYVPPFPPGISEAQYPIPMVTHLHGGETNSIFDGHPEAWFTKDEEKIGPTFITSNSEYPNKQPSMNLWYHDHTLGMTRLNVYYGMAGFYIIKDKSNILDSNPKILPQGKYDISLVIKDCSFNRDGSLYFPWEGDMPDIHPYWNPEFYGDTILVNGRVWPNLNVEKTCYRFRILNGSNARFYNLKFSNGMYFIQIGTDGGYLRNPVRLTEVLIAPAERIDILVNFSEFQTNTKIIMENDAAAPYPGGDDPDPNCNGLIMQFTVKSSCVRKPNKIPRNLNLIPNLKVNSTRRILVLTECIMNEDSTGLYLNGQKYTAPIYEMPLVGSTEEWTIVNLTGDTHPIHLHLIQFLIKNRQDINVESYSDAWMNLNGMPPLNKATREVPLRGYLIGNPISPDKNEDGWKDTAKAYPGQVLRLIVRFTPQEVCECDVKSGVNLFPFDPSMGPGYLWHCHILDHEDNEMMRPYMVMVNKKMDDDMSH